MSPEEVVETQSIASLRGKRDKQNENFPYMGQYSTIHNAWGCKPNVVSVCYVM